MLSFKEFLKMVGMKSWMLWLGWLIHALLTNLFSIVVVIILMKVPFWGVAYPPIEFSNGVILFLFLFFYCMAAITFCFLIATIMNKRKYKHPHKKIKTFKSSFSTEALKQCLLDYSFSNICNKVIVLRICINGNNIFFSSLNSNCGWNSILDFFLLYTAHNSNLI
jgi:uncharacterized membrane protein